MTAAIHSCKTGHSRKPNADPEDDTDEAWEEYTVCAGCSASPYPCRTVAALIEALGADDAE